MPVTFRDGDLVLLVDSRNRRYMFKLQAGQSFHSHHGGLPHDLIIGRSDGARVRSPVGHEVVAMKPTLADYILRMSRSSQVIYPKDLGPIVVFGDIYPGATVVEAGVGAGALSLALLRAVGSAGRLITYEIRSDLAAEALRNIQAFTPDVPNFLLKAGDITQPIEDREMDRMVLDIPEPWRAVDTAAKALRLGGILLCYLPTVLQIHQLWQILYNDPRFEFFESFEFLQRPWHLGPSSARPTHRMVAHTGFITRVTRCEPRTRKRPIAEVEVRGDMDEIGGPVSRIG